MSKAENKRRVSKAKGRREKKRPASVQRGTTRPMGMTASYALGMMRRQADREGKQSKAEWLSFEDGSHPTVEEAIEWLESLDPNYDVINDKQLP